MGKISDILILCARTSLLMWNKTFQHNDTRTKLIGEKVAEKLMNAVRARESDIIFIMDQIKM